MNIEEAVISFFRKRYPWMASDNSGTTCLFEYEPEHNHGMVSDHEDLTNTWQSWDEDGDFCARQEISKEQLVRVSDVDWTKNVIKW